MKIDDLYQEIILDHYKAKHHSGLRDAVRCRGASRQSRLSATR